MELTARVMQELSETIGPRFSGSEGEHRAAHLLTEEFAALGAQTELQRFGFIGWQATSLPSIEITAPESRIIECAPVVYSAPAANLHGTVSRHGTRTLIEGLYEMTTFAVSDNNTVLGYLVVNPRGGAIPLINPRPLFRAPQLVIDQEAGDQVERWIDAGQEVRITMNFASEIDADAYSYNVIARYVGNPQTQAHVVVCAHYDTQIDTPGAYDNASGTAGMFGILERLQADRLPLNVTFVGIAGEEVGMHGSHYYVNDLKERGVLEDVRYCVCLDQISGGDFFWLWCTDPDLRQRGLDAIADAQVENLGPVQVDDNKPGADHWAFHEQGIPSCLLMWWRQEDYHRPSDTFDKADFGKVAVAVDAAYRLLQSLETELL